MGARTTRKTSPSGSGSDLARGYRKALGDSYRGAVEFQLSISPQQEGFQCRTRRFWETFGRELFRKMLFSTFGALSVGEQMSAEERSIAPLACRTKAFFFGMCSVTLSTTEALAAISVAKTN